VNHLISNEEFAEQLDALLKASTESHDRLQDALVDCLLILQDSKRRGVDAALTHLLGVIQQQARPDNAVPREDLDRVFQEIRAHAAGGLNGAHH